MEELHLGLCATAFLFDGLMSVMEADGTIDPREEQLLEKVVPTALMQASGFIAGSTTSPLYERALTEGRRRLAGELPEGQGAGLVRHLWTMAAIDEKVDLAEIATIIGYAEVAGIDARLCQEIGADVIEQLARRGAFILVPETWQQGRRAVEITSTAAMPKWTVGHAFSCSARELFTSGVAWDRLQAGIADALEVLAAGAKHDAGAFCCTIQGVHPRSNQPEERLVVLFARTGRAPSATALIAVRERLESAGASIWDEGTQPLPDRAFPTLYVQGGVLHQVWLPDETGPVALRILWDTEEDACIVTGWEPADADPDDFMPEVVHALLV